EGWQFNDLPVSKDVEAQLLADRTVNGEFTSRNSSQVIRVFSSKRYSIQAVAVSLLTHTPDICWAGAGWKKEFVEPQFVDCSIRGLRIRFERRLFIAAAQRELVYFGAMF